MSIAGERHPHKLALQTMPHNLRALIQDDGGRFLAPIKYDEVPMAAALVEKLKEEGFVGYSEAVVDDWREEVLKSKVFYPIEAWMIGKILTVNIT